MTYQFSAFLNRLISFCQVLPSPPNPEISREKWIIIKTCGFPLLHAGFNKAAAYGPEITVHYVKP